jgi:hypothetical protein
MRSIALSALLLVLAACAGPAPIDERAAAREDARRELERECRIAAMQRREDPRCPRQDEGQPPQTTPLELPPATPPPPPQVPPE